MKREIHPHPRLALPDNPDKSKWAYYSIMCVTPIVMEDLLILFLSIPLTDKSLEMDLYQVSNLPAIHLKLKAQFTYILEGKFLAISASDTYAAISP